MECNRTNCKNILCDRYSKEFGYICNDCFIELGESNVTISEFMKNPKIYSKFKESYIKLRKDYLEKEFPMTERNQL